MEKSKTSFPWQRFAIALLVYLGLAFILREVFAFSVSSLGGDPILPHLFDAILITGFFTVAFRSFFLLSEFEKNYVALEVTLNFAAFALVLAFLHQTDPKDQDLYSLFKDRGPKNYRIAILKVNDLSSEGIEAYMLDAMQKSLLNGVAHIENLKAFDAGYIDPQTKRGLDQLDHPTFKHHLKPDYLLSTTILDHHENGKFGMEVSLLDPTNFKSQWSKQFESSIEEFFVTIHQLSNSMAEDFERTHSYNPANLSPEAIPVFLEGLYYYRRYTMSSRLKAAETFQIAAELDDNTIIPELYKSLTELNMIYFGLIPNEEKQVQIREVIAKGLEQELPEAYTAQGLYSLFFKWDWQEAESNLTTAIDLAPYDYLNFFELGLVQGLQGKVDRSIQTFYLYRKNDPLNELYKLGLSVSYLQKGILDSAYQFFSDFKQTSYEEEPDIFKFHLIIEYYLSDDSDSKLECSFDHGDLVCAWLAGRNKWTEEQIDAKIASLTTPAPGFKPISVAMLKAGYHSGMGNFETCKKYLYQASNLKSPYLVFLNTGIFPWLKADEDGRRILRSVGLEET